MRRLLLLGLALGAGYWLWMHPVALKHPVLIVQAAKSAAHDAKDWVDTNVNANFSYSMLGEVIQPAGVLAPSPPQMYNVSNGPWAYNQYTITPLFGYSIQARVLSKEHYTFGREADLSNFDLALGWQQMSDSLTLSHIDVRQSDRWYYTSWGTPDISESMVATESGNFHTIAGNAEIFNTLKKITKGNVIAMEGFLVRIESNDGWHWVSGTSNWSEGAGSCKVVWITKLNIIR